MPSRKIYSMLDCSNGAGQNVADKDEYADVNRVWDRLVKVAGKSLVNNLERNYDAKGCYQIISVSGLDSEAGCCEHVDEPSGSSKGGYLLAS
jgi:hypothetical protein